MTVDIREVRSAADLKRFIRFPHRLYRGNTCWVPQLDKSEKFLLAGGNPALTFCTVALWLATRDGEPVGRIAGIINRRSVDHHGKKTARFGWIDFVDDPEVSAALLGTVEAWARKEGMEALHGPLGFTDLDQEGMLVEGFDELGTIATIYNHPYYPAHLERLGYAKDVDWVEFELALPETMPDKLVRIAEIVKKKLGLTTVVVTRPKEALSRADEMFALLNQVYANLYGFVPLTPDQIAMYVEQYFGFVQPGFICLVQDREGKLAAFGITMPSLSKAFQKCRGRLYPFGFLHILRALKKNDRVDLYLIGVRPDLQGKGVNAVVMREIGDSVCAKGIRRAETNLELETNDDVTGQWKFFEHRQHKRRRCYLKTL